MTDKNKINEMNTDFVSRDPRFRLVRCPKCRISLDLCVCKHAKKISPDVEFWMLINEHELQKPTNTAFLIKLVLPETRFFLWKRREPNKKLIQMLNNTAYLPHLVFPFGSENAFPALKKNIKETGKKAAFILLDGTWPQARKIFRKSDYLHDLPKITLTPHHTSNFALRRQYNPNHLCTYETAAEVLFNMGQAKNYKIMDDFFITHQTQYLASKGLKFRKLIASNDQQA